MLSSYHSSSDSDGGYMEEVVPFIADDLTTQRGNDISLVVGSQFEDAASFREFVRTKSIAENFGMKIKKSDRKRILAICAYDGCPWRVRASVCQDGHTFEVRKIVTLHSCPGINRAGNKQATYTWVAHEIEDMVKKYPDIPPKQINNSLETKYGLSLPYMKLWRSRQMARDNLFGAVDDNYSWIPALQNELINRNPNSHVKYEYNVADNSFERLFVSFKVCINGFLAGCRYLIGLDACHLKSKYLGVLLAATALDGNNGLFPLAFAVVDCESKRSWQWFLENLTISLEAIVQPLAFISDMEKGLAEAMRNIFPFAEHRVCMRHLWKNIKKSHLCQAGQKVKNLFWAAANTYAPYEHELKMTELLKVSPQLHTYLNGLPYKWAKSHFWFDIKNQCNTNNLSESFNSWIREARDKPIVELVDTIRGMLMVQRAERKVRAYQWNSFLVPAAEEYIRDITTERIQFIVRQSSPFIAEIEENHERQEVNLQKKECSCRYWQMTGLPCIHAVTFIGTKEHISWHEYVHSYYHTDRYRIAYEGPIGTLPGINQWSIPCEGLRIEPPNTKRPRGRPKKRRIRSFMENTKKQKSTHRCGRCGGWGHHQNTCKNPISQETTEMPNTEMSAIDITSYSSEFTYSNPGSRVKLPVRREVFESNLE